MSSLGNLNDTDGAQVQSDQQDLPAKGENVFAVAVRTELSSGIEHMDHQGLLLKCRF